MKIGIISDTHGSLPAWIQAYENYFYTCDVIIHCGDILYHGPRNPLPEGYNPAGLAHSLNQSSKPILFAKGNCDAEVDQLLINFPIESPFVHLMTTEYRILVHHGHNLTQENLPAGTINTYNLIISGHTHIPEIRQNGTILFLNPGSTSLPKNENKEPTIAVLEDHIIRIINPWTRQIIMEAKI